MKIKEFLFLFLSVFIFAACSSDDDEGNLTGNEIFDHYFEQDPDLSRCYEGILKDARKKEVLDYVNYVRSLHNLPSVSYDYSSDIQMQKAALIGLANETIIHDPPTSSKCYSQEGADGCSLGNLSIAGNTISYPNQTDIDVIDGFMKELNSTSIGHRRWLLYPFLKYTSYGRTIGKPDNARFYYSTSALKIGYDETQDADISEIPFVAYPYGEYPSKLFETNCFLSFSVVLEESRMWGAVDFASTTVVVKNGAGTGMVVTSMSYEYNGSGLPNSIKWKVSGLEKNVSYTISIDNVFVKGVKKDFQYEFKIVD